MAYYSAIILIQVLAAVVMIMIISVNPIITLKMRRCFCAMFMVLTLISVTEWLNILMNGSSENLRALHYAVKVTEFISIPIMLGIGLLVFAHGMMKKIVIIAVAVHGVLQIISTFFGWIFFMDAANYYVRGRFYILFVLFYAVEIVLLLQGCYKAGKEYQGGNPVVLVSGALFCMAGIGIQLLLSDIRTAFLTAEISLILCYIYVNSLILQTDRLTGLLNRWSYEKKLETIKCETCIIIFDLDSFKTINDTFGHMAGDECLKATAMLLREIFAKEGHIYRIGGDEFCVIFNRIKSGEAGKALVESLIKKLESRVEEFKEDEPRYTGISLGYAFHDTAFSIQWAVEEADHMMYLMKEDKRTTVKPT